MDTMIEFTCTHCGKLQQRPVEEAGMMVACDCGQANQVPWSARKPLDVEPPAAVVEAAPAELVVQPVPEEADVEPADVCFQHENTPATQSCEDCGVRFCDDCVVRLRGVTLCGPCKNLRLRRLQRPTRVSVPAIISTVLALCGAPISLCVTGAAEQSGEAGLGFLGAAVPLVGLVLGAIALVQIERDPKLSGRSLAISGIVIGLVGIMLSGLLTAFMTKTI